MTGPAPGRPASVAAAAALLAVGVAACASIPEPPQAAPSAPVPSITASDGPVAEIRLPPRSYPVPPRPWITPEVHLSPAVPRAGTAAGITVAVPCYARSPRAVHGEFGDQRVPFGELHGRWFGMVAFPPEESGERTLRLRYRLEDDSTVTGTRRIPVRPRSYPSNRLSVAPRYSSPPASVRDRIERERRLVDGVLSRTTPRWLLGPEIRWPRPERITSSYGERRVFNDRVRSRHWGVDLRGRRGAPVRAAARGRVALVHHLYFAGRAVYLDHGLGVYTGYFHLSKAGVEEGQMVEPGEVIGEVGASGRVTGPHLHWALYVQGTHVDPRSLFSVELPSRAAHGDGASGRTACSLPGMDSRNSLPRRMSLTP